MDLRWMAGSDLAAVLASSHLFDERATPENTARFLRQPTHHLCIAYVQEVPVGFVSGIEMTHPDKGTEMFLYELGVDEEYRGRGIGHALVAALAERAQGLGCYGMWVLTDDDNEAALRTYASAGAGGGTRQVMLEWRFP